MLGVNIMVRARQIKSGIYCCLAAIMLMVLPCSLSFADDMNQPAYVNNINSTTQDFIVSGIMPNGGHLVDTGIYVDGSTDQITVTTSGTIALCNIGNVTFPINGTQSLSLTQGIPLTIIAPGAIGTSGLNVTLGGKLISLP